LEKSRSKSSISFGITADKTSILPEKIKQFGLSLAREIMRAHGGTLTLDAPPPASPPSPSPARGKQQNEKNIEHSYPRNGPNFGANPICRGWHTNQEKAIFVAKLQRDRLPSR
jgi:hypothetical protein